MSHAAACIGGRCEGGRGQYGWEFLRGLEEQNTRLVVHVKQKVLLAGPHLCCWLVLLTGPHHTRPFSAAVFEALSENAFVFARRRLTGIQKCSEFPIFSQNENTNTGVYPYSSCCTTLDRVVECPITHPECEPDRPPSSRHACQLHLYVFSLVYHSHTVSHSHIEAFLATRNPEAPTSNKFSLSRKLLDHKLSASIAPAHPSPDSRFASYTLHLCVNV